MKKRFQVATASVLAAAMIATNLASVVTASAYTAQPPEGDLILWYDMEDAKADRLPDRSGKGLDGVINGGALFAEGIKGTAITLDGEDDYIEIPDLDRQLAKIGDFTASVYLKVEEDRPFQRIFDFGTGETGKFMCLMTRSTNQWDSGLNYTISENGGGAAVEKSVVVKDGAPQHRWFHLALVYQQGIARIYYDGVQMAEAEIALKPSDIAADADGFHSYLGKSLWNDPLFRGEMDDFRLYSRALTEEELAEVANLTDEEKVREAKELLTLPNTAVQDLELLRTGAYGTRISWRSSRPEVITADGKVTRPSHGDVLVKLTATIQSGTASRSKDFFVTVRAPFVKEQIQPFHLEDVTLLDGELLEKEEINRAVMDSISADTILYAFRYNANQNYGANLDYKGAPSLHGWAEPGHQFAGHLEGHYMSALAMLYGRYHDADDKAKLDAIVDGLAEIQGLMLSDGDNPGDPKVVRGYLSAFPESRFDQLEAHQFAAVPWYMIHKIMAGLLDAYNYCGNEKALEVADNLAQWAKWRMERLGDRAEEVLSYEEYGGMNEVLLNMYAATGKEEYLPIAALFEERERLFDDLYNGVDNLNGMHGNTYLAKIVGLTRNYQLSGDEYYRLAAEHFWDFVVEDGRTYVNGGNSIAEHYQAANTLSHQLNGDTCETCNVYNLLKISRDLFEWSGDIKYLDYYEQGLFNQILGSMNPEGDKTYFQPMGTNRRATWNDTVYGAFCCNGTGLENFSKLNECLYFSSGNTLYIAQFAASALNWEEQGVQLKQETSYPYADASLLTFEQAEGRELTVMIRIPSWIKSGYTIELNGEEYASGVEPGFVAVTGEFKTGDTIRVSLPMDFARLPMGDDDKVTAFTYGPVALAAIGPVNNNGTLAFDSQSAYETWKGALDEWFQPAGDGLPLHFSAEDGRGNSLLFVPFTEVGDETYTTYFTAETGIATDRGDNLALGKAVKASEQYSDDYGPEKAVDGINRADVENRWCVRSDAMPQWFKIDLGAETLVTNVDFTAEKPAEFQYVIEYSSDPGDWADDSFASGNWQMFYDGSNNTQVATLYSTSGEARARYLRIRFLSSTNGVWAGMRELEVYSSTLGLLKDAIFEAEWIDRDAYLSTTDWADFDSALNEARGITEKADPQADEILLALDRLQNALDTLQLKSDTTVLLDKIAFIQQYYLQDEYTAESWAKLEKAIAEAMLICDDEAASVDQIDVASYRLNQALYELVARSDRERVAAKLAQISQLNQSDYTMESWKRLQDAAALAQQTLEDENTADSAVSEALSALETAIFNLVENEEPSGVDKTMLESLIKATDGVFSEARYTGESWAAFDEALAAAKALVDDKNATQAQVYEAYLALVKARDGLEYAPDNSLLKLAASLANDLLADEELDLTEASRGAIQNALDRAESLADDASQEEINAVYDELMFAIVSAEEIVVNKSQLIALIDFAGSKVGDNYKPSTYKPFLNALTDAKAILAKEDATQEEIDVAYDALLEKLTNLVVKADFGQLQVVYNLALGMIESGRYGADTLTELEALMNGAKTMLDEQEADDPEIKEAARALTTAMSKVRLEKVVSDLEAKVDATKYTAASVEELEAVIAEAKELLTSDELTPEQETEMTKKLNAVRLVPTGKPSRPSELRGGGAQVISDDYWDGVREKIQNASEGDTINLKLNDSEMMPAIVLDEAKAKSVKLDVEVAGKNHLITDIVTDASAVYYSAAELIAMADGEAKVPAANAPANSNPETGGEAAPAIDQATVPASPEAPAVIAPGVSETPVVIEPVVPAGSETPVAQEKAGTDLSVWAISAFLIVASGLGIVIYRHKKYKK